MHGNGRNNAVVKPEVVGQERSTEGIIDGHPHPYLDLSLSLSRERTSENVRSGNSGVVPPVEMCHPDTHVEIQERTMGSFGMEAFLIGRARARIDHCRRTDIFVERVSGLPAAYAPIWTAATATIVVNAAFLHGRVLGHARIVTEPTGFGNYVWPSLLIGGSDNSLPVPSQSGFDNHPASYILPPIRSSNLVPMFSTSVATVHPLIVTTMGNGPFGRQIYGVMVGQGGSGEMNIMCSCHGVVLSPSAFVEHAGGTSSGQPMDRIIACMRPIPF